MSSSNDVDIIDIDNKIRLNFKEEKDKLEFYKNKQLYLL